jgi:S-adenosylmethionine:tRNA ribosyltransferase-isomerase
VFNTTVGNSDWFDYALPAALIAPRPAESRQAARLLVLKPNAMEHRTVGDLPALLPEGALVVLNQTRVRRARLIGQRPASGGRVELLLLETQPEGTWSALGKANRPLKPGDTVIAGDLSVEVVSKDPEGLLTVRLQAPGPGEAALHKAGLLPLPPYIQRLPDADDLERYQTVFAKQLGSVAAPTAGLHFSRAMLDDLTRRGMELGFLTLHVGLGTFRPVTVPKLQDHVMHSEHVEISDELVLQVRRARRAGRPVVAVGTTVVRALESAASSEALGELKPMSGHTRLFITPGYHFRVVDGLLTNFHMPRSSLLALVAAFAGDDLMASGYRVAIERGYRFLSYGDAMWIPECHGRPA